MDKKPLYKVIQMPLLSDEDVKKFDRYFKYELDKEQITICKSTGKTSNIIVVSNDHLILDKIKSFSEGYIELEKIPDNMFYEYTGNPNWRAKI